MAVPFPISITCETVSHPEIAEHVRESLAMSLCYLPVVPMSNVLFITCPPYCQEAAQVVRGVIVQK